MRLGIHAIAAVQSKQVAALHHQRPDLVVAATCCSASRNAAPPPCHREACGFADVFPEHVDAVVFEASACRGSMLLRSTHGTGSQPELQMVISTSTSSPISAVSRSQVRLAVTFPSQIARQHAADEHYRQQHVHGVSEQPGLEDQGSQQQQDRTQEPLHWRKSGKEPTVNPEFSLA